MQENLTETDDSVYVFNIAHVKPEFPGGNQALMEFILNTVEYPAELKEAGIEGKVFVRFVIDKDGKVTDLEALEGKESVDERLKKAAINAVSKMPDWSPGQNENGEKIKVSFVIPINFSIPPKEGDK